MDLRKILEIFDLLAEIIFNRQEKLVDYNNKDSDVHDKGRKKLILNTSKLLYVSSN